jgi:glucose-6-phosphate dehydrogenase assembly protein OpcA
MSSPANGGIVLLDGPQAPGEPVLRWSSKARSIEGIERELTRIWSSVDLTTRDEQSSGRHVAARTSVMNLVVIARRPEFAERCAATIRALTGRHPSRTLIVQSADPDGPSWLDARVEAHCILPRADAPETCAEMIHLSAGGESGRRLASIVAPLVVHDLPVTVWWPGEPPFASAATRDLLATADRLIVDGSTWSGDGLGRLSEMVALLDDTRLAISDFALVRQSRWREAIASIFDDPEFTPYLRSLRRISVTYATHDESCAPDSTNLVKPLYHVAWLASRLDLRVSRPLSPVEGPATSTTRSRPASASRPVTGRGLAAGLTDGRHEVAVVMRPVFSPMPAGTTLRVELLAERRGSELRADVTAETEIVHVHVWQDGVAVLDRGFLAPRRTDVDLLAEAIELGRRDPITVATLLAAAALTGRTGQ